MNTNSTEWYDAMTKAMKKRDHALMMLSRWQTQLNDAEEEMNDLATMTQTLEQVNVNDPAAV